MCCWDASLGGSQEGGEEAPSDCSSSSGKKKNFRPPSWEVEAAVAGARLNMLLGGPSILTASFTRTSSPGPPRGPYFLLLDLLPS